MDGGVTAQTRSRAEPHRTSLSPRRMLDLLRDKAEHGPMVRCLLALALIACCSSSLQAGDGPQDLLVQARTAVLPSEALPMLARVQELLEGEIPEAVETRAKL